MDMEEVFASEVYFSGHVQGVGFRYKTLRIAREFEISGYVRNLPDGRVEMIAEGEEAEVSRFVGEVIDRMDNFIRRTERSDHQRPRRYQGFTIAP
jgi:acylphosphatase